MTFRWTVGRRSGYPVLLDESAAPAIAALVERQGLTELHAFQPDLEPLRPLVSRWGPASPSTAVTLPPRFLWADAPVGPRRARRRDLTAVTDFVWRFSPHAFPNRWLLRQRVRRAIDELVLVAEDGTPPRIVAVAARDSTTQTYDCWAHVAVDPEFRLREHAWNLVAAAADAAHRREVGVLGFAVASNPMPLPEDTVYQHTWLSVDLGTPNRFPGERRLRRLGDRLLSVAAPPRGPRNQRFRSPGAGDGLVSSRRTQEWWRERGRSRD